MNADYDAVIAPGDTADVGFLGRWKDGNGVPAAFTLNGRTCR
jgi:hypothetical protein